VPYASIKKIEAQAIEGQVRSLPCTLAVVLTRHLCLALAMAWDWLDAACGS